MCGGHCQIASFQTRFNDRLKIFVARIIRIGGEVAHACFQRLKFGHEIFRLLADKIFVHMTQRAFGLLHDGDAIADQANRHA